MPIDDFVRDPAKKTHVWYSNSALNLPAAPEYATGEVLVAGAYRRLVLGIGESEIDLEKINELPDRLVANGSLVSAEVWSKIFFKPGGLRSPTVQGQSRGNFLPQLCPVVPAIAAHAGVLGQPRNRWNPGNLIVGTMAAGTSSVAARGLLLALRDRLLVDGADDISARFLERELGALRADALPTAEAILANREIALLLGAAPRRSQVTGRLTPAEQACIDLPCVLALKSRLTRRQWTALLEGFLRFALGTHLLWLCRLNQRVWLRALMALDGREPLPSAGDLQQECFEQHLTTLPALHLGQNAVPLFKAHVEQYVIARFGFSVLAHTANPIPALEDQPGSIGNFPDALRTHLDWLRANKQRFAQGDASPAASVRSQLAVILDKHPKFAAAAKGTFGNNLVEYLRYTLGQMQPSREEDSEYDQAYLIHKRGNSWHVNPGPALQILWAHLCCRNLGGTASVRDLANYLASYGVKLPDGQSVRQAPMQLAQLGLVIDSPDAAGGRMLVDPFPGANPP